MTDRITYFGTAINKQPEQLLGRIYQIAKNNILPVTPIDINNRYQRQVPEEIMVNWRPLHKNTVRLRTAVSDRSEYKRKAERTLDGYLSFLNDTIAFSDGHAIRLSSERITSQPIHWRIKCFGFEHIKWAWLGYDEPSNIPDEALKIHQEWLSEWLDGHEIARERGYLRRDWTPHAVSLRICNWCRYDAWMGDCLGKKERHKIRSFVWKNAAFLSDNVEYGVGGNHLIENGVALVIAGSYLENQGWLNQGKKILLRAVENQILPDGGHIERSPMYHLIVCQRLLTATDLLESDDEEYKEIREKARDCVSFIDRLSPPDEQIPLLNDSVLGEALALTDCLDYANSILPKKKRRDPSSETKAMPETGYYWLGQGTNRLLAVAGDITVPHLPAHAHAHPAQICLWVGGHRVITDTGVYEYAAGGAREQARSVEGHNTVQVDRGEPLRFSDEFLCWGNISPEVEYTVENDKTVWRSSYAVDAFGCPNYQHERKIVHQGSQWIIQDQLEGIEDTATSRLHIHPDYRTEQENERVTIHDCEDKKILSVTPEGHHSVSISQSPYYPEYGQKYDRDVIKIQRCSDGEMQIEFHCCE